MPSIVTRIIAILIVCTGAVCAIFMFGLGYAIAASNAFAWHEFGLLLQGLAACIFLMLAFGISRAVDNQP